MQPSRYAALTLLAAMLTAGAACGERTADRVAELTAEPPAEPLPSATPAQVPAKDPIANIVFSQRQPAVGDRIHETFEVHTEMDLSVVLKKSHSVADEKTARDGEILALSGGVVTKVKLSYTSSVRSRTTDGAAAPNPGPEAGRSYLVERKSESAPILVESDDGKPVSDAERFEIEKGMSTFGKPDKFSAVLASKPRHVGEKLDDVALVMKERLESDLPASGNKAERPSVKELSVILRGLEKIDDQEVALLEVTSVMTGLREGAETTIKTKGKMWVKREGTEVVRLSVEGSSDMVKGVMSATGKMTLKTATTRLPRKTP